MCQLQNVTALIRHLHLLTMNFVFFHLPMSNNCFNSIFCLRLDTIHIVGNAVAKIQNWNVRSVSVHFTSVVSKMNLRNRIQTPIGCVPFVSKSKHRQRQKSKLKIPKMWCFREKSFVQEFHQPFNRSQTQYHLVLSDQMGSKCFRSYSIVLMPIQRWV